MSVAPARLGLSPGRAAWIATLVVVAAALILVDWPATLTDEDDYMPFALGDVLAGKNPYTTRHEGSGVIERPWGDHAYSWTTTYPYLPTLLFLQLPGVDYRWVALAAYAAMLVALAPRRWGFYAFANPVIAVFAASGFNDFVPFALVAWAARSGRGWPAWIAATCKQGFLPLLAVDAAVRRDWRRAAWPALALLASIMPFLLLDAGAFFASAFGAHADKAAEAYDYWNYWLYPLYFFAVMLPDARAAR